MIGISKKISTFALKKQVHLKITVFILHYKRNLWSLSLWQALFLSIIRSLHELNYITD